MDPELMKKFQTIDTSKSGKDFEMTPEEVENITKAFEKEEFRNLFMDYMKEISDPKARAERDEYLKYLESQGDVPENIVPIHPNPGWAIEGETISKAGSRKVYVNIVYDDNIEKTEFKANGQVSVPCVTSTIHMNPPLNSSMDQKSVPNPVSTIDVCFHKEIIGMSLGVSARSAAIKDMICKIALENADKRLIEAIPLPSKEASSSSKQSEPKLERLKPSYSVIKSTKYVGGSPATISVPKGASVLNQALHGPSASKTNSKVSQPAAASKKSAPAASNEQKEKEKEVVELASPAKHNTVVKTSANAPRRDDLLTPVSSRKLADSNSLTQDTHVPKTDRTPSISLVHRGTFEMADHFAGRTGVSTLVSHSRPKELVIKVDVPGVFSSSAIDCEIEDNVLCLETAAVVTEADATLLPYKLKFKLPYPVDAESCEAKFDKKSSRLTLTVPVLPPSEEEVSTLQRDLKAAGEDLPADAEEEAQKPPMIEVLESNANGEDQDSNSTIKSSMKVISISPYSLSRLVTEDELRGSVHPVVNASQNRDNVTLVINAPRLDFDSFKISISSSSLSSIAFGDLVSIAFQCRSGDSSAAEPSRFACEFHLRGSVSTRVMSISSNKIVSVEPLLLDITESPSNNENVRLSSAEIQELIIKYGKSSLQFRKDDGTILDSSVADEFSQKFVPSQAGLSDDVIVLVLRKSPSGSSSNNNGIWSSIFNFDNKVSNHFLNNTKFLIDSSLTPLPVSPPPVSTPHASTRLTPAVPADGNSMFSPVPPEPPTPVATKSLSFTSSTNSSKIPMYDDMPPLADASDEEQLSEEEEVYDLSKGIDLTKPAKEPSGKPRKGNKAKEGTPPVKKEVTFADQSFSNEENSTSRNLTTTTQEPKKSFSSLLFEID